MRTGMVLMLICVLLVPTPLLACLWDSNTIAREKQRFPVARELIAGHFLRHSEAYYQWRIERGSQTAREDRSPGDYDILAVAYEKLGQHDRAIELIQEKIKRWPREGRYESEANLGTFLIHAGRYTEGLTHIDRALEINPDGHFGREIYQKYLVEYVLAQQDRGYQFPLSQGEAAGEGGFAEYVLRRQQIGDENRLSALREAYKGVMGMMWFGNHRSPALLEALGDLLLAEQEDQYDRMLAARAYLSASYEVQDPAASREYRKKAQSALAAPIDFELSDVEADLKQEIEQAEQLFQQIAVDESKWLSAGLDLNQQFSETYADEPILASNATSLTPVSMDTVVKQMLLYLVVGVVIVILVAQAILRRLFRHLRLPENSAEPVESP
ncbi:Tetratricopeptide repeat protein [Gimesia panareensis]|uniref:Tetratricopeptide repeat protein n=1 Tax=Gimesia panareensis TaxID=2527978 RepID=A0A517Q532_9PLAN|nr:hypothetical protein [Gimesia panareensis]QDT26729.1 Tetratricopeptide repeat protein [Gimesia panareensis]